jgi:hypothetical protein
MHKFNLIIFLICSSVLTLSAQSSIEVTDQTVKLDRQEDFELYFGFAAGDKILFSFEEINGKELKEIEILEYPNNSKFSEFKTKKIQNKTITIAKESIYVFKFKNSNIIGRICKVNIQRIPKSEDTKDFNTTVKWVTKQETTFNTYTKDVIIGYDTIYQQKSKKVLVKVDTTFNSLFDKTLRVHALTSLDKSQHNTSSISLPKNIYFPNQNNPYQSTEVICWTYWIGVGKQSSENYEKTNKSIEDGISLVGALSGNSALASLAITGISLFQQPGVGDNVSYKFIGYRNGENFIIDHGDVVSASGRNDKIKQGSFTIDLYNDNYMDVIDVDLKMIVMQVNKTWEDLVYTEQVITPKYEKQTFSDPMVTTSKVPEIVD